MAWDRPTQALRAGPGGDLLSPTDEAVRALVDQFGPPPRAFHVAAKPVSVCELPLVEREGDLYDVLLRRRTTRSFDLQTQLPLDELAVVLRYVFGYHGYAPLFGEVTTLKRTSPSAGGFHPVEAYPVVTNVAGLDPGFYHYDARDHALELIDATERRRGENGRSRVRLRTDLLRRRTRPVRARRTFRQGVLEVPKSPRKRSAPC